MKQNKNIHVLPTEKPSRLRVHECGRLFLSINFIYGINDENKKHIYITSDEEIKEGDWCYNIQTDVLAKCKTTSTNNYKDWKKIILTTDQDLIKNGVQAIDDEFLEWFVKNPSCEFVEVNRMCYGALSGFADAGYKIIIPKEEPKQEFPQPNIIDNWLEKNGDPEIHKQVEQKAKELCEQETLYCSKIIKEQHNFIIKDVSPSNKLDIRGAKWQQEQIYNQIKELYDNENITGFSKRAYAQCLDIIEQFKKK